MRSTHARSLYERSEDARPPKIRRIDTPWGLRSQERVTQVQVAAAAAAEEIAKDTALSLFGFRQYVGDSATALQGMLKSTNDKISTTRTMQRNLRTDVEDKFSDLHLQDIQHESTIRELNGKMQGQSYEIELLTRRINVLHDQQTALLHTLAAQVGNDAPVAQVAQAGPVALMIPTVLAHSPTSEVEDYDGVEHEEIREHVERALETSDDEFYEDGSANFYHCRGHYVEDEVFPGVSVLHRCANRMGCSDDPDALG